MPEKEFFVLKIYGMKCAYVEFGHKMAKYGHWI